jgi:hypothetical protein
MTQPYPTQPVQPEQPKKRRWVAWAVPVGAFLLGAIIGGAAGEETPVASADAPTATTTIEVPVPVETTVEVPVETTVEVPGPTVTVTAKPAGPSGSIPGDGTYIVGAEVKPGTYKAPGGELCYWARLDGQGELLDNHLGAGQAVATIRKTDKGFESSGCGEWKRIK